MQLEKGQVISDRYKIVETLGRGGMAIVYKANDLKLGRDVTFKVLKSDYIEDKGFIKRFNTEARAAAQLAHTNIVNVYDVGNDGDIYYIVMEYIDGFTLNELIYKKAPLDNDLACDLAMQIAAGLENAHAHGVIHRDIKPENILLTKIGGKLVAKVTDFGIAKANSMETTQGDYMGSVHYFSPEQAKGDDVDQRSDLYSLGIVLYQMVTGTIPFEGNSALDLAMKHIKSPIPDPRNINPNVSQEVIDIIKKACAKEPKNRYQNARAMCEALKNALEGKSRPIPKDNLRPVKKVVPVLDEGDEDDYDNDINDEESIEIKKKERNVIIIAIITGILIILLITIGGSMLTKTLYGDTIKVPNFVGMSYEKACLKAEKKGLTVERKDIYKADVDAGDVAQQTPEKGERVNQGATVVLYVSSGAGDIQVPNIVGMRKSKAEDALAEMGLEMGNVEYVTSDKPIGEVIEQSPEEGEMVGADTKIDVKVSQGSANEEVKMPDLKLKTEEEASILLEDLGLEAKFIDGYSDTVPVGSVIDQGIAADTMVQTGSQVAITICRGEHAGTSDDDNKTAKVPAIVDIEEPKTEIHTEHTTIALVEHTTTAPVAQSTPKKQVDIVVNPSDTSSLADTNNVKVTAKKNGSEEVIWEKSVGKTDFPFTVPDKSDGSTTYTVTINGKVVSTVTK